MNFRSATSFGPRQQGFTLLEIMIVVVIVGIMIAVAGLSVGSVADDGVDEEARRLGILIGLAADEANMQGRELGLRFFQHKYEFSVRNQAQNKDGQLVWIWTPLEDDDLLKPRDLGENITLELELEGDELQLDYEPAEDEDYQPQIYVMSSGDIEPEFQVRVRPSFNSNGLVLSVDALGRTEMTRDED